MRTERTGGNPIITILDQRVDEDAGTYRIKYEDTVRYITISKSIFDNETMCMPFRLEPRLRNLLPRSVWSRAQVSAKDDGSTRVVVTNEPLPELYNVWHENDIDVLSLARKNYLKPNVREVEYLGQPAICKTAPFEWDFRRLERESWAYGTLDEFFTEHPFETPITPKMLGHVVENGRVTGLLLEKVEGTFASIEDLASCADTLRRLHVAGITHGDINRYNFVVNRQSGQVRLVDFEHADRFDEEKARLELESLTLELAEDTDRGKPVTA